MLHVVRLKVVVAITAAMTLASGLVVHAAGAGEKAPPNPAAPMTAAAESMAGLSGYWTMDAAKVNNATVMDASGNGLNGVMTGGVVAVEGKVGKALQFDGTNGAVTCANEKFPAFAGDVTVMAWIKTGSKRAENIVSRCQLAKGESGFTFGANENGLLTVSFTGDTSRNAKKLTVSDTKNPIADGNWHHVAAIIKPGHDIQFYVDGGLSSRQFPYPGYTQTINRAAGPVVIGGEVRGLKPFTGVIDDVRIYERVVSTDEMAAIYGAPVTTVADGETLYNGITLHPNFPPYHPPVQAYHTPDWITNPPRLIPIDIGRQLFFDDFLIEKTDLTRSRHRPTMLPEPVLKNALPFSGGVWWDPSDKKVKMWYTAGGYYCYAWSDDGINWTKPAVADALVPNSNKVLKQGDTVWLDLDEKDPAKRFKAFCSQPGPQRIPVYMSPDGIHWTLWPKWGVTIGDRTTVYYNPFRKVWVNSMRRSADLWATANRGTYTPRARFYAESTDLVKWTPANPYTPYPTYFTGPDENDPPYVGPEGEPPQLYNLDAVAYESVMVGLFSWFYPGKGYRDHQKPGPILVEIGEGFSRDGFDWVRPARGSGPEKQFIPASNKEGTWNGYNTQSVGGCFLIMNDELWFYFTGRTEKKPASGVESTGLAKLRRDGFYSMDSPLLQTATESLRAQIGEGTLTTRQLKFAGKYMFVNVDAPQGKLQVEALDADGNVIAPFTKENCVAVTGDKTKVQVKWNGADDLSALSGKPVKFRFHLTSGKLYSFWVTPSASGASNGYVAAAGGPEFAGNRDVDR